MPILTSWDCIHRSSYLKPYFLYPEAFAYQLAIGVIHLDNVLEELTYGAREKPRGPNISIVLERLELDTDVPGCRVSMFGIKIFTSLYPSSLQHITTFTMSVTERTYIMIKVRCDNQVHQITDRYTS